MQGEPKQTRLGDSGCETAKDGPPKASLPMYDWPEVSGAWDRFWALAQAELAASGIEAPAALTRQDDAAALWADPGLVVSQTCGWPFVSLLSQTVIPFARFDFGLSGPPGHYCSVFIGADPGKPAQLLASPSTTVAVNDPGSQSGFRALGECCEQPTRLPRGRILLTGSHRESIRAVAEGRAGLAAIDAVSWRLALAHEPAARKVAVLGLSDPVPGLPLITARGMAARTPALRAAISAAFRKLPCDDCGLLGLKGVVPAAASDYEVLKRPPLGWLSIV